MNASKTLTSAITAATILGAVSFVYAQTTDSTSQPADQGTQMTTPAPTAAPDSSTTNTTPADNSATAPAPSSTDSTAAPADLAPKPDRN
jgi:hypothetical protein